MDNLKMFLKGRPNSSEVTELSYRLSEKLKEIHSSGYVVESIRFDTLSFDDYYIDFGSRIPERYIADFQTAKNQNIRDLAYTHLGMYVCSEMLEFQNVDPSFFDYSAMCYKDPEFVKNNYDAIRETIPYGADYYDEVVSGQKYDYFDDYVNNQKMQSSASNSRGIAKVYATAAGRAYAKENDFNDAAYTRLWFYPIIIACVCILSFVVYILYTYL